MFSVLITNEQSTVEIDTAQIELAVNQVVEEAGVITGDVSVAIVDDPTMHQLNIEYLNHDYPTDVLSFVLERDEEHLEGEIIVSVDTAVELARDYQWSWENEFLLYIIHGCLHLVGYDDKDPSAKLVMQEAERRHLLRFGIEHRVEPPKN
ncbi:MAG: rRNA maturation RNase YbeY [Planctomycetaceae bacterium]|jgi:probable rRNA maturation factor|nr:rRNA maturation RNase YbeY [Planctomycetaceae bacterium]|tara:strand:+ start:16458 stop:16907 length:450 start_codon:yes stop_codon:yes gene_type:complete